MDDNGIITRMKTKEISEEITNLAKTYQRSTGPRCLRALQKVRHLRSDQSKKQNCVVSVPNGRGSQNVVCGTVKNVKRGIGRKQTFFTNLWMNAIKCISGEEHET